MQQAMNAAKNSTGFLIASKIRGGCSLVFVASRLEEEGVRQRFKTLTPGRLITII